MSKKILILNGPNLNLLGTREPEVYGSQNFDQYFEELINLYSAVDLEYFQTNVEGEIINKLQSCNNYDGVVLNAAGYTHTSVAIRDCIAAIKPDVIEVHISNIASREGFRHTSMLTGVCKGSIMGLGLESYRLAIEFLLSQNES